MLKNGLESLAKLFASKDGQSRVIVVGCGRLGANIANTLCNEQKDITVIDKDKSSFQRLSPDFSGKVLLGEGVEFSLLREAEIRSASMMIAVTNDDNTNILISQMAREIFYIGQVIARISDPEKVSLCESFGINVINPIILAKKEIESLLGISRETGNYV